MSRVLDRQAGGGPAPMAIPVDVPMAVPMAVPMVDVSLQNGPLRQEIAAALLDVVDSGQYILGPNVAAFECEVAAYLGAAEAVALASGTDALHLALLAAGIGPGDEVITTPFSFIATANAIRYAGARPVFVDIDPVTYNIDADAVAAAITPATRAVLPVHLYGQPAAMEAIAALCARHGLLLIEDCAQSFGARRGARMCGAFGLASCFSFYPSKNLGGMGDGGMVVTSSADFAARLRRLRNHGSEHYGMHETIGFNSRLDELQAAVLRIKLRRVDAYNEARRAAAREYGRCLSGLPLSLPREDPAGTHVYHQYTVLCADREGLRAALAAQGVATAVHYRLPLHRQPTLAEYGAAAMPVAERVAAHCLSLPMYPGISAAQIERVATVIAGALSP